MQAEIGEEPLYKLMKEATKRHGPNFRVGVGLTQRYPRR